MTEDKLLGQSNAGYVRGGSNAGPEDAGVTAGETAPIQDKLRTELEPLVAKLAEQAAIACNGESFPSTATYETRIAAVLREPIEGLLLRIESLEDGLNGIRGMIGGYAGQPTILGDIYKIADVAVSQKGRAID